MPIDLPIETVKRLYLQEGLSKEKIGEILGCSEDTIRRRLKANNRLPQFEKRSCLHAGSHLQLTMLHTASYVF